MAKKLKKDIKPAAQRANAAIPDVAAPKQFSLPGFRAQALILALLGFIFYANTFQHEAAFDDRMAITDNEYVQAGLAGIPDILTKDAYQSYLEHRQGSNQLAGGRYRPLSLVTFAIEQQMMGVAHDNETANKKEVRIAHEMHSRHVVNVLLYILSVIVLLYFLRKAVFPLDPLIAFLAALLFTILPVHTEVVANVKSRDEILSVLFILLTFIKAFTYLESKKVRDLLLALLCFFLALLSKEYAVTLVVLLPLSFYLFRKEQMGKSIRATLPYLIPLGVYLFMRFAAVSSMAEGAENNVMNNPYLYATGLQKIATELLVMLDYLKLLIFPNVLSADYSYNQIPYTNFANPLVWLSIIVYLGMIISMCILFTRRHVLCFAIAVYVANLALVSNIFFNIGAPMGERLIYHSSIGFCMAVAWLIYKGFAQIKSPVFSKVGLAGFMIILITLCGFKTTEHNKDWKNDTTLFLTDVQTVPNSVLVNNNAAAACMSNAKINKADIPLRNEWFEKAINYFDRSISIYPQHMQAHLNRGLCYFNMGYPAKAIPDWDTVRKYEPSQPELPKYLAAAGQYFYSLGMRYSNANMPDSAIYAFKKCTETSPEKPEPWYCLGKEYYATGDYPDATNAVEKAMALAPESPEVRKLYEQIAHPHP